MSPRRLSRVSRFVGRLVGTSGLAVLGLAGVQIFDLEWTASDMHNVFVRGSGNSPSSGRQRPTLDVSELFETHGATALQPLGSSMFAGTATTARSPRMRLCADLAYDDAKSRLRNAGVVAPEWVVIESSDGELAYSTEPAGRPEFISLVPIDGGLATMVLFSGTTRN